MIWSTSTTNPHALLQEDLRCPGNYFTDESDLSRIKGGAAVVENSWPWLARIEV